jgi:hypothetical protein
MGAVARTGKARRRPAVVNVAQARFLRFFLSGEPDRALWLRDGKRLGLVAEPFDLEPRATHVLVYRIATGEGAAYPGEAIDRTRLAAAELHELAPFWSIPLRRLNAQGQAAARARRDKLARVCAFRQTDADRELLEAAADRSGLTPGLIAADIVSDYLARTRPGVSGEGG